MYGFSLKSSPPKTPSKVRRGVPQDRTGRRGGRSRRRGGCSAPPKIFFFFRAGRQAKISRRPRPGPFGRPGPRPRREKKFFFFPSRQKSLADRVPARAVDRVPDRGGKKKFFFFPGGQAKISRRPRPGAFGRPGPRGRARSGNDGNFFFSPTPYRRPRSVGGYPRTVPVEGGDDRAGGGDAAPPRKNFFFSRAGRQKPLADRVPAPSVDRVPEVLRPRREKKFFFFPGRAGKNHSPTASRPVRSTGSPTEEEKKNFFFPGRAGKNLSPTASRRLRSTGSPWSRA